jgi:hypothetical protein
VKVEWVKEVLNKYKKKTLVSVMGVTIVYGAQYLSNYIATKIEVLYNVDKFVKQNAIRISALELRTNYYDDLVKTIVTRTSFDNYILRKDKEFEDQASFNLKITSEVGLVDGKVDELSIVVNELNSDKLYKISRC